MNTKKKILFLVTQSEFGGAQRFIYRLVTNLDLSRYDILVAAGPEGNNADGLLFNLQNKNFKVLPLKFLKRAVNPIVDFLGFIELKKTLKREKPDILFLCSSKAGFLGGLASKSERVSRIIYRIGGWTFNDPWPKWKKKLYIWLEKKTAGFKDFIVNNADSDRQQAEELGIKPKKKILTIYNGLDTDTIKFLGREEARGKLNLKTDAFVVGAIANDYPAKGLKYLTAAKEGMQGVEVVALSGISDASKYLNAFDVFVLPSVKEGFPWVILEAMAAGIPVIATRVGALPEIIKDGENGILIKPGSPEAIIEAVKKMINNRALKEKLAREGKKTVIDKFNLRKMVKEYEDLFFIN